MTVGNVTTEGIAGWNGNAWSEIGGGMGANVSHPCVYAMTIY